MFWAFTVKNMAKRPAKNISSLDSQTMVPTLTMFGRFSECTRWPMEGAAVVTRRIMSCGSNARWAGSGRVPDRVLSHTPARTAREDPPTG
ncbi:hypothetical protein GCM10010452_63390 [Crossiella cryophila]